MFQIRSILVTACVLALPAATLSACGQTGALYLPEEPSAASLPQSLLPAAMTDAQPATPAPSTPAPKTP
ncbi:MAG: lipoprotein [Hylemonella sp.]|nr:lipoprotein [Hylemonella sp.]MDH5708067.1 lipoprotein [Hylemonella sp.]